MKTQQDIVDFCSQINYDLRKSHNGRWIDQKCAADVVTVIADCIYNYGLENGDDSFTTPDIWHYQYTVENVVEIFKKPDVESAAARNEYDKFFQQPMEMLANAGVLGKVKQGTRNFYYIDNRDVLEYIALRERNALFFLQTYIKKTMQDSGMWSSFNRFFELQNKSAYNDLKNSFSSFIIANTPINGVVECNRIFIKVLNPLAYQYNSYGTERGRLSEHKITYDMLMYNRNNFRDVCSDKPKGITRKEYAAEHPFEVSIAYYRYQSAKAKRFLRVFNDQYRKGQPELLEIGHVSDKATHIHHIFPESDYPEICYYLENLVALTPTQHLNYAHPNGRTQEISETYQQLLLLSKADRIDENLRSLDVDHIYGFDNFLFVLNVGFDDDAILEIADMDFPAIINAINVHYA